MIRIQGDRFADEHGRTLILRGVNLGGSSKVPFTPDGATWRREGFFDHRTVSFVGRPFPLEEADEHFGRLAHWGFTFLRLLTTWEAIEHAGPGQYDETYLAYFRAIVEKAAEHGISVFIDPHQDVWSRFTGGDGAPGWTLEAAGLDLTAFAETGAAIAHQEHGDPFPRMIWPTNYGKLANLTMWTLFFGGDVFAPDMRINGVPAQEYLQGHYIAAISAPRRAPRRPAERGGLRHAERAGSRAHRHSATSPKRASRSSSAPRPRRCRRSRSAAESPSAWARTSWVSPASSAPARWS